MISIPRNFASAIILLATAIGFAFAASSENFDKVDANHDGSIDREEFKAIATVVDGFFGAIPESVKPILEDAGFTSAFLNSLVGAFSCNCFLYLFNRVVLGRHSDHRDRRQDILHCSSTCDAKRALRCVFRSNE